MKSDRENLQRTRPHDPKPGGIASVCEFPPHVCVRGVIESWIFTRIHEVKQRRALMLGDRRER